MWITYVLGKKRAGVSTLCSLFTVSLCQHHHKSHTPLYMSWLTSYNVECCTCHVQHNNEPIKGHLTAFCPCVVILFLIQQNSFRSWYVLRNTTSMTRGFLKRLKKKSYFCSVGALHASKKKVNCMLLCLLDTALKPAVKKFFLRHVEFQADLWRICYTHDSIMIFIS